MRVITATDSEVVEPGVYQATLRYIEDGKGKFGDYYDWTFEVLGPAGPVEVSRRTSTKFGPATIARQIVEALLGRKLNKGDQIDLDSVIGRTARVKVTTNDNGYSTISDIAPLVSAPAAGPSPMQQQAAQPQAAAPTDEQILAAAGAGSSFADDIPF